MIPFRVPMPRSVGAQEWKDVAPEHEERERRKELPPATFRQAIGVDMGYTENAGDYASVIPVAVLGARYYVRDLIRVRRDVIHLRTTLHSVELQYPGSPLVSYIGGQEKAVIALLAEEHSDERTGRTFPAIWINGMIARFPKEVRSQRTSEIWNDGRIIVPPGRSWTSDFTRRMKAFTGKPGEDDADTDALVSAIDWLEATRSVGSDDTGAFKRVRS